MHDGDYDKLASVHTEIDAVWELSHNGPPDFTVYGRKRQGLRSGTLKYFVERARKLRAQSRLLSFVPPLSCVNLLRGLRTKNNPRDHFSE